MLKGALCPAPCPSLLGCGQGVFQSLFTYEGIRFKLLIETVQEHVGRQRRATPAREPTISYDTFRIQLMLQPQLQATSDFTVTSESKRVPPTSLLLQPQPCPKLEHTAPRGRWWAARACSPLPERLDSTLTCESGVQDHPTGSILVQGKQSIQDWAP